jgi:hypothetical protein
MIRKFIIKNFTSRIWNKSPKRKIEALQEFSTIEKDSGCQILWALELIKDPKLKSQIFQHVLEEFFHADLFEGISNFYSPVYIPKKVLTREILVDKSSSEYDVWKFFAYAHVGEEGVNSDFSHYANTKNIEKKISSIFLRVSEDENNHIYGTRDILLELVKKNKVVFYWLIIKSTFKRNLKQFESYTSYLGSFLLKLVLMTVYYFLGFFVFKFIRTRFEELTSDEIVALIKEQQIEL